jgi:hypothetical protein
MPINIAIAITAFIILTTISITKMAINIASIAPGIIGADSNIVWDMGYKQYITVVVNFQTAVQEASNALTSFDTCRNLRKSSRNNPQ